MRKVIAVVVLFAAATCYAVQEKPKIVSMELMPGDPVVPVGDCTSSTGGYVEHASDNKPLTEAQMGKFVFDNLRHGYIIKIYPRAKTGIFVSEQCTNTTGKP